MATPIYDKTKVYEEQVTPLLEKIYEICLREGIPMLATFAYSSNAIGTHLKTTLVPHKDDKWIPESIYRAKEELFKNTQFTDPKNIS